MWLVYTMCWQRWQKVWYSHRVILKYHLYQIVSLKHHIFVRRNHHVKYFIVLHHCLLLLSHHHQVRRLSLRFSRHVPYPLDTHTNHSHSHCPMVYQNVNDAIVKSIANHRACLPCIDVCLVDCLIRLGYVCFAMSVSSTLIHGKNSKPTQR